jgi:hypothetical protein
MDPSRLSSTTASKILLVFALVSAPLLAQQPITGNLVVAVAQDEAVRAVNFDQGDLAGLTRARADFTREGWDDFMKRMQGFLDANGAPTFTSRFVVSGNATILREENGIVYFRVPGTLAQSNKIGKTTYRAVLEVRAGGNPVRIEHLEQITCPGVSPACP